MGVHRVVLALAAAVTVAAAVPALAGAAPQWQPDGIVSPAGSDAADPVLLATSDGVLVALWYDDSTILASSRGPGDPAWSTAVPVSGPALPATGLRADAGPDGRVTAVWVSAAASGDRIETATSPDGRAWSAPQVLSAPGELVAAPDVAIGTGGDAAIVWRQDSPAADPLPTPDSVIPLWTRAPGSTVWTEGDQAGTTTTEAFAPQVAVDGTGGLSVAWLTTGGQVDRIRAKYHLAQRWSLATVIAQSTVDGGPGPFDMDATHWVTRVAWQWVTSDHTEVWVSERLAGGPWAAGARVSDAGENAVDPVIGADGEFSSAVVWRQDNPGGDLLRAYRQTGGGAGSVATVGPADDDTTVRVATRGDAAAVVWTVPDALSTPQEMVATWDGAAWSAPDPVSTDGVEPGGLGVAVDPFGNVAAAWVGSDGTHDRVRARVLDADGPMSTLEAVPHLARGRKPVIPLTWNHADWRGLPVTGQQLRTRRVSQTVGLWFNKPVPEPPATGLSYAPASSGTYCFEVAATAGAGTQGPWSSERCSTLAIDDRVATNLGWQRIGNKKDYRGTVSRVAKKGEKLTFPHVTFDELWLLVRTSPDAGKVDVFATRLLRGNVSLASPGSRRRVAIPIFDPGPTFDRDIKPQDIRVVTLSGKPVVIDGIYAVNHVPVAWHGAE